MSSHQFATWPATPAPTVKMHAPCKNAIPEASGRELVMSAEDNASSCCAFQSIQALETCCCWRLPTSWILKSLCRAGPGTSTNHLNGGDTRCIKLLPIPERLGSENRDES